MGVTLKFFHFFQISGYKISRARMPSSQVFAINNRGRVFSLSTDQAVWLELAYLGIEFKRVSAHETVIWALGGDHQVYVYVYGSSVPIRVCEETYENQVSEQPLICYMLNES